MYLFILLWLWNFFSKFCHTSSKAVGSQPAGPKRHRGYSARHQQPHIDAASHQAKSLIPISACVRARYVLSVIHDAAAEGFSCFAAAVFSQKSRKCPIFL